MGQVPKKIIYAQAGAKLIINLDGKDVEFDENDIDKIATSGIKMAGDSGELKDPLKMMEAFRNFKDLARKGKYYFDTDKESGVVGMKYEGDASNEQLGLDAKGDVSRRSGVGRRFSHKVKDTESAYMARLHSIIGSGLNEKFNTRQTEAATAQKVADATIEAKKKADADALHTKYGEMPNLEQAIADRLAGGNRVGIGEVWKATPNAEKQRVLTEIGQPLTGEWDKYEPLKAMSSTWMEPFKKEGNFDFSNPEFVTNFYTRAYGAWGKNLANDAFGIQTPEEIQKAKAEGDLLAKTKAKEEQHRKLSQEAGVADMVDTPYGTKAPKDFSVHPTTKVKYKTHKALQADGSYKTLIELVEPDGVTTNLYEPADDTLEFLVTTKGPRKVIKNPLYSVPSKKEGGILVMQEGGKTFEDFMNKVDAESKAPVKTEGTAKTTLDANVVSGEKKTTPKEAVSNAAGKRGTAKKSPAEFIKAAVGAPAEPAKPILDTDVRELNLDKVTKADMLDLGALGLDLGSIGATFVPGYGNAVGAGAGLGATAMGLAAQSERGELGLKDWGAAGVNVALDIGTLIPVVGTAAKSAKILRNLDKAKNIFTAIGAGNAVLSAVDAIKEGNYSMNNIHTILNASRAILGARKKVNLAKNVLVEGPAVTPKGGVITPAINKTTGKLEQNVAVTYDHNTSEWKSITKPNAYIVPKKKDFLWGNYGPAREVATSGAPPLHSVYTKTPSMGVDEKGVLYSPLSKQATIDKAITKAQSQGVKSDPFTTERKQLADKERAKAVAAQAAKASKKKTKTETVAPVEPPTPSKRLGGIIKAQNGTMLNKPFNINDYSKYSRGTLSSAFKQKPALNFLDPSSPLAMKLKEQEVMGLKIPGNYGSPNSMNEGGVNGNEDQRLIKNPKLNLNSDSANTLVEIGRTLLLNKAVKKLDLSTEVPLATPVTRVNGRVDGDLTSKMDFFNQAAQTRERFARPVSSDASLNLAQRLAGEQAASAQERQGIGVDAEARGRQQDAALAAERQYNVGDASIATQNAAASAAGRQQTKEKENARTSQLAGNIDTLLSSTLMRGMAKDAEKQKLFNTIDYEKALNELNNNSKYAPMFQALRQRRASNDYTIPEEWQQAQTDYMTDAFNLKKGLATGDFTLQGKRAFKKGGSFRDVNYERELSKYKEMTLFSKDLTRTYNRWAEKTGEASQHISEEFSKKMSNVLGKIHK